MWANLLRMVGLLKYGQTTASLLRSTIHAEYLSDPAYRRKTARQLNKGGSLHALRRDLHYVRRRTAVACAPVPMPTRTM